MTKFQIFLNSQGKSDYKGFHDFAKRFQIECEIIFDDDYEDYDDDEGLDWERIKKDHPNLEWRENYPYHFNETSQHTGIMRCGMTEENWTKLDELIAKI